MRKINFSEKENSNLNLVNNAVNVSKKFNEMCLNKDDMKNFFLKNSKGKSQKIKNENSFFHNQSNNNIKKDIGQLKEKSNLKKRILIRKKPRDSLA